MKARFLLLALASLACDLPAAPPPPVPEAPPPVMLPGADPDRWARGLADFKAEFVPAPGVGFNDTSCAACHALPGVGGAGDLDHTEVMDHPVHDSPSPPPPGSLRRIAPPLFLLGAIDALTEDEVAKGCGIDPELGIAGFPKPKTTPGGVPYLGRFGRELDTHTLLDFTAGAFRLEMGVPNHGSPDENSSIPGVPDGISADRVADVAHFLRYLGAPPQKPQNAQGKAAFSAIGCAVCHVPHRLYGDGCGHLMGPSRALHEPSPGWPADAWRTAYLVTVAGRPLGPDGSAETVAEAIEAHRGEASQVYEAWVALPEDERGALEEFVGAL